MVLTPVRSRRLPRGSPLPHDTGYSNYLLLKPTAAIAGAHEGLRPRFACKKEGDRRGSNPRPSGPQSVAVRCTGLRRFANPSYLSRFLFPSLPCIAGYCAPPVVSKWCQRGRVGVDEMPRSSLLGNRPPASNVLELAVKTLDLTTGSALLCVTAVPPLLRRSG
jgi:hypothetical protein